MTKCNECGYDSELPVGIALEDIKPNRAGHMKLSDNGFRWQLHKAKCEGSGIE